LLPSLRERLDDIPELVQRGLHYYGTLHEKKISKIDPALMAALIQYRWPGNIRELQNVIERAVILCDGDTLTVDETWLKRESPRPSSFAHRLGRPDVDEEKQAIKIALKECGGRVSGPLGAAAKLGVPRSTLESKIKSLGINKHSFKSEQS